MINKTDSYTVVHTIFRDILKNTDASYWQSSGLSGYFSTSLHDTDRCFLKNKHAHNTKQPSALLTENVQRHASLLGTKAAAMLLLDHADPCSEHPCMSPTLSALQRGDPASQRMQTESYPFTHTHTHKKSGIRRGTESLIQEAFMNMPSGHAVHKNITGSIPLCQNS